MNLVKYIDSYHWYLLVLGFALLNRFISLFNRINLHLELYDSIQIHPELYQPSWLSLLVFSCLNWLTPLVIPFIMLFLTNFLHLPLFSIYTHILITPKQLNHLHLFNSRDSKPHFPLDVRSINLDFLVCSYPISSTSWLLRELIRFSKLSLFKSFAAWIVITYGLILAGRLLRIFITWSCT